MILDKNELEGDRLVSVALGVEAVQQLCIEFAGLDADDGLLAIA